LAGGDRPYRLREPNVRYFAFDLDLRRSGAAAVPHLNVGREPFPGSDARDPG
jgi:hypothetical protein